MKTVHFFCAGNETGKSSAIFAALMDSVALSSHGNTALIGGPGDDTGIGAAWVFLRPGKTWTQQGDKLTGRNEIGNGSFGSGVALASDGQTALIGGSENDNSQLPGHNHFGVAWDFTRSGST